MVLFLLVFVAPSPIQSLTDSLYPPVISERRILGIFERHAVTPNPVRDERYAQLMTSLWITGMGLVLILLINHIPVAVAAGKRRAATLEAEARASARVDPGASASLRRRAEALIPHGARDPEGRSRRPNEETRAVPRGRAAAPGETYVGLNRRYRLDKVIGSGGMGVVHAAYDTVLGRPVALKQLFDHLLQDAEQTERFRQEALALASLNHPHIVTVYDLLEDTGHFWIVMELLLGGSLADRIAAGGKIGVGESIEIACEVAAGLSAANANGIVHRDVKPMNILFTADGVAKLTDFGNAKLTESVVRTQEGLMIGSPAYMSPEQVTGAPFDHQTDIYSLGISLYQMLTGKVPFEGDMSTILAQHVAQPPRPPRELNPDIPAALEAALLVMLSKTPEERFEDADAVVSALQKARG